MKEGSAALRAAARLKIERCCLCLCYPITNPLRVADPRSATLRVCI
jgi:hypothetical protein